VDPHDGWVSHAWDYATWLAQAVKHLEVNNRQVPADLGEQMQEQLCMTLPPGWCNYDDPNRPRASNAMTWDDVQSGIKTFARWMANGCRYVPQQEAERRAQICTRCYLNVNIVGCAACHAAANEVTKGKTTRSDPYLKGCAACKCLLRAKVHLPLSILDKENSGVQQLYPDHCWLKQNGQSRIDVPD
jgi:hypothetical protein